MLSPLWRGWVHEGLLPLVSGEHQAAHTRCARRKAKIRHALEVVQASFHAHAITTQLAPRVLEDWKAWAVPADAGISADLIGRGRAQGLFVAHAS